MGNRIEVDNEGNVTCIIEDVAVQLETEALIAENADLRRELELDEPLFETLNAANDALLSENEQLRRERDFYFQQVTDNGERAHRAIDALNAENDALRELVMDMYEMAQCFYVGTGSADDLQELRDRMGELGVDA